jgi:hypothetical protein
MRKYFVVAEDPIHKDNLHAELMAPTGSDTVPNRPVEVIDPMPGSEYNGVFYLTDAEAQVLEQDPRVQAVCLSAEDQGLIKSITSVRAGLYDKSPTASTSSHNWGLLRCINTSSYSIFLNQGGTYGSTTSPYTYNLDGTGVDIIFIDTGIEPGHPEFAVNPDGSGGSRVVDIDWTQFGYITSIPTGGFMGDWDGHGTNVASIAAGNSQGWATGAAIYSFRCIGSDNGATTSTYDGRTLGSVDNLQAWQTIRAFHLSKPITSTGYCRPTIVSCSYGYFHQYGTINSIFGTLPASIDSITYRGTTYTTSTTNVAYGTINTSDGGTGSVGQLYSPEDAEIKSAINVGIIVVGAAGNNSHKIDVPGGLDYNNYITEGGTSRVNSYYHRGATPGATTGVICVGCVAAYTQTNGILDEHKRNFSETGPRIDIWAPGDYIMGAYANKTYAGPAVRDPRNNSYFLNKISGTSQACPQVAGVLALACQIRPWFTATTALNFIQSTASTWQLNEYYYSNSVGYGNLGLLQGAPAKVLYNPFNSSTVLKFN